MRGLTFRPPQGSARARAPSPTAAARAGRAARAQAPRRSARAAAGRSPPSRARRPRCGGRGAPRARAHRYPAESALRLEGDHVLDRAREHPVAGLAAEPLEILGRQVDASVRGVLADVAQHVPELEPDPELVGEGAAALAVGAVEDAERQAPDRARHAAAVPFELGEGHVLGPARVELRAFDQVVEGSERDREPPGGVGERDQDRLVGFVEASQPPRTAASSASLASCPSSPSAMSSIGVRGRRRRRAHRGARAAAAACPSRSSTRNRARCRGSVRRPVDARHGQPLREQQERRPGAAGATARGGPARTSYPRSRSRRAPPVRRRHSPRPRRGPPSQPADERSAGVEELAARGPPRRPSARAGATRARPSSSVSATSKRSRSSAGR